MRLEAAKRLGLQGVGSREFEQTPADTLWRRIIMGFDPALDQLFSGETTQSGDIRRQIGGSLISRRSIQVQAMRCRRSFRRNLFCRAALAHRILRMLRACQPVALHDVNLTLDDPIQADALRPLFRGQLEAQLVADMASQEATYSMGLPPHSLSHRIDRDSFR